MQKQPTVIVAGQEVVLGTHLYGVRWWAQHYVKRVPAFDPMYYFGSSPDNRLHYFRTYRDKAIVIKSRRELFASLLFKPFLLNLRKLETLVRMDPS